MALWAPIGVFVPILLIFGRRANTPHGWVVLRCIVAFFVAWTSLALGSEYYLRERGQILIARGALEESMALDGVGFGSYFLGWIPSLVFIIALAWLRRLAVVLRWKGWPGFSIAFLILALSFGIFTAWRHRQRANYAPISLHKALPRITGVTIYSLAAPIPVNEWESFATAGQATMPVKALISAAETATYSGVDQRPPDPALVTIIDLASGFNRRARFSENHFAFEGLDGFFTVTGAAGEEYRRQFRFAKEAAFAEASRKAAHVSDD